MGRSTCIPAETLSAFLDGELTDTERQSVGLHLRECSGCADLEMAIRVLAVMTDGAFARLARTAAEVQLPRGEREL